MKFETLFSIKNKLEEENYHQFVIWCFYPEVLMSTFATLWANSADDKLVTFFPENSMETVCMK